MFVVWKYKKTKRDLEIAEKARGVIIIPYPYSVRIWLSTLAGLTTVLLVGVIMEILLWLTQKSNDFECHVIFFRVMFVGYFFVTMLVSYIAIYMAWQIAAEFGLSFVKGLFVLIYAIYAPLFTYLFSTHVSKYLKLSW